MLDKQPLAISSAFAPHPKSELTRLKKRSSNSWRSRLSIDRNSALKIFLLYTSGLAALLAADYGASVFAQDFLNGRSPPPATQRAVGQNQTQSNNHGLRSNANSNKGSLAAKQQLAPLQPIDQAIGDWRIQCAVQPQRFCRAFQIHMNQSNQTLLLKVEVAVPPGAGNNYAYSVLTPLGLKLSPELAIESDQGAPLMLPILTCRPDGCVYYLNDQSGAFNSIWSSKMLATKLVSLDGKAGAIGISVRGLAEARALMAKFMSHPGQ